MFIFKAYIHRFQIILLLTLSSVFIFTVDKIKAAEIRISDETNGRVYLVLDGEILKGDYERLISALRTIYLRQNISINSLKLYSFGGDLVEAIKIGLLVNQLKIRTWSSSKGVLPNYSDKSDTCASSCFFIFAGGIARYANYDSGHGEETLLAIHRPYFEKEYYATQNSTEAKAQYDKLRKGSQKYLEKMEVGESLISRMFNISSDEIQYLTMDEYKKHIGENVPFWDEWLNAKCKDSPPLTKGESFDLSKGAMLKFRLSEGEITLAQAKRNKHYITEANINYLSNKDVSNRRCRSVASSQEQKLALAAFFNKTN